MLSGELVATATYSSRKWQWDPRGFLRIELHRGRQVQTDVYAVDDLGELPGLMGRRFKLSRLFETLTGGPYEVTIGGRTECTCTAGECRAKQGIDACKHLAAMTAAYEAGAFGVAMLEGVNP